MLPHFPYESQLPPICVPARLKEITLKWITFKWLFVLFIFVEPPSPSDPFSQAPTLIAANRYSTRSFNLMLQSNITENPLAGINFPKRINTTKKLYWEIPDHHGRKGGNVPKAFSKAMIVFINCNVLSALITGKQNWLLWKSGKTYLNSRSVPQENHLVLLLLFTQECGDLKMYLENETVDNHLDYPDLFRFCMAGVLKTSVQF